MTTSLLDHVVIPLYCDGSARSNGRKHKRIDSLCLVVDSSGGGLAVGFGVIDKRGSVVRAKRSDVLYLSTGAQIATVPACSEQDKYQQAGQQIEAYLAPLSPIEIAAEYQLGDYVTSANLIDWVRLGGERAGLLWQVRSAAYGVFIANGGKAFSSLALGCPVCSQTPQAPLKLAADWLAGLLEPEGLAAYGFSVQGLYDGELNVVQVSLPLGLFALPVDYIDKLLRIKAEHPNVNLDRLVNNALRLNAQQRKDKQP